MSTALFNDSTGRLVCFKPLGPRAGHTIRTLSSEDSAFCKAANGRPLKWDGEAVAFADINPADLPCLDQRQFTYLRIGLGISDAQVVALINAGYPEGELREKALADYRVSPRMWATHPLVAGAIDEFELDAQTVYAAWLNASRA